MIIVNKLGVTVVIIDVLNIGDYMGPLTFYEADNPIVTKIREYERKEGITVSTLHVDDENIPDKSNGTYYIVPQELCDSSDRNDFFTPSDGIPGSHTWVTTGLRMGMGKGENYGK